MKHWNPDIIGYWLIGESCQIEKDLELSPSPPNCSEIPQNCYPCSYLSTGQVY